MAKLSAHGREELLRLEYPTHRLAVMSDGKILKNSGSGWKEFKRLKPEVKPVDYAIRTKATYDARPRSFHTYVKALIDAVTLENRWRLHTAIELMPTDPDGVWSELDDWNGPLVEAYECRSLCELYLLALDDAKNHAVSRDRIKAAAAKAAAPVAV